MSVKKILDRETLPLHRSNNEAGQKGQVSALYSSTRTDGKRQHPLLDVRQEVMGAGFGVDAGARFAGTVVGSRKCRGKP
jgi:hypothetical protein